jgi:type I restriction enzyme S subunit
MNLPDCHAPCRAQRALENELFRPSLDEQATIVAYLDKRRHELDSARQHVQVHIERLREYRSSLISAAVTGQLNISEYKEAA